MGSGKVLLGVLAGAAAGTLAGILFAPEKGSVTRERIAKKSQDSIDDLKAKFNKILDIIAEKVQETEKDAEELASKTKRRYNEAKKETEEV